MAFPLITWVFSATDRGTHSGAYFDKLNNLITEINGQITAYNAQEAANTDSLAIKGDIEDLLDAVAALRDETTAIREQALVIRNQTTVIRDATEAIALGDINGTSPDFLNVKINGIDVYHPGNKPTPAALGLGNVNNVADVNKPISTAQQAVNEELEILAMAGIAR